MKKGKTLTVLNFLAYFIGLVINLLIYLLIYSFFNNNSSILLTSLHFIVLISFVAYIIYKKENTSFKLSWIVFALFLPVTAIFMYMFTLQNFYGKNQKELNKRLNLETKEILQKNSINIENNEVNKQVSVIKNLSAFNAFCNTEVKYLEIGEKMQRVMLEEMKKAKKFIFLEYFIISKSSMLDEILEVLFTKASSNVEVKILFDAAGSGSTVPKNFVEKCLENRVKCVAFNKLSSSLYKYASFRDHRKMTVIDGNVCISGGINIADEYVNRINRFGHWKDTALLLKGDAVLSFTTMFIKMWEFVTNERLDITNYYPTINVESTSIVMPYGDGPDNKNNPAINLYTTMINSATKYLYIATPYLILDENLTNALALCAKSGVDVRIVVPGIPDKKFIFQVTKSNYDLLVKSGVKIYEYTPGFIHCKSVLFDDTTYTVGSINFDFRSLFWNYECATWVYDANSARDIRIDFENLMSVSRLVDANKVINMNVFKRIANSFLKAISPLL